MAVVQENLAPSNEEIKTLYNKTKQDNHDFWSRFTQEKSVTVVLGQDENKLYSTEKYLNEGRHLEDTSEYSNSFHENFPQLNAVAGHDIQDVWEMLPPQEKVNKSRAASKVSLYENWKNYYYWMDIIDRHGFPSQDYIDSDHYHNDNDWLKEKLTEINNTLNKLKKEYKWV